MASFEKQIFILSCTNIIRLSACDMCKYNNFEHQDSAESFYYLIHLGYPVSVVAFVLGVLQQDYDKHR